MRSFFNRLAKHGIRHVMRRGGTLSSETFCRYCEKHWKPLVNKKSEQTVLVGLFDWNPSICAYLYTSHYLAESHSARLAGYFFGDPARLQKILPIYRSFGVNLEIDAASTSRVQKREAALLAREAFEKLDHAWDIFSISHDGVVLGDLIYDTFLRYHLEATIDPRDPRLLPIVKDAIQISMSAAAFFSRNNVEAVVPYDPVYINSGIVHRHAILRGIPCYVVEYNPYRVYEYDSTFFGNDRSDYRNWPKKDPLKVYSKSVFSELSAEQQKESRLIARVHLESRLNGKVDPLLVFGRSAFSPASKARVFCDDTVPRILVFLHDFCDAPNYMRWNLFPDFYHWLDFLLDQADRTPFQWYVKPHPNIHKDDGKGRANHSIVEHFRNKYPKVKFLDPSVSNRQIIEEKVNALFTVRGTAGHEFAYCGIPVVNAGDNYHIEYNFNLNPRTITEFKEHILNADRLDPKIDKTEIESFYYLRYLHLNNCNSSEINLLPSEWLGDINLPKLEASSKIFEHFISNDTLQRREGIRIYLANHVPTKFQK
ncbi:MAG: hypothetical protein WC003_16135 [Terrimicrobiaceae bacterium]